MLENSVSLSFIEELQRAKCASEAPLVRKIGNTSSRENLIMTSSCECPSFVQRLGQGGGGGSQIHPRFRVLSINTFRIPLEVTYIQIRLNQN